MPLREDPPSGGPARVVVSLSIGQALASTAAALVLTVTPSATAAMAGSGIAAGWGQTSTIVGASLLAVPVAKLAERFGRAPSLGIAFGTAAAGSLLARSAAGAGSLIVFLVGLAALGGGTVAALALRFAAADSVSQEGRGRAVGIVLAAATVGSLVGPNLATLLHSWTPAGAPYLVVAVLYAAAAGICGLGLPAGRRHHVDAGAVGAPATGRDRDVDVDVRIPRNRVVAAILVMTAGHMAMVALMGTAPLHLAALPVAPAGIGVIMSAHLVSMYAFGPLFGAAARRAGTARCGLAALALGTLAALLLAVAGRDAVGVGAGLAALGLAWSLGMVASSLALAEPPIAARLRLQGRGDLALNVGGGLSSLAAGLVLALVGYSGLALGAGVGLLAAMIAAAGLAVASRKPDRSVSGTTDSLRT